MARRDLSALELRILVLVSTSGRWEGDEASLETACADVMGPGDTAGRAVEALEFLGLVKPHYTQRADATSAHLSSVSMTSAGYQALRS